jgi:hypothetical protein
LSLLLDENLSPRLAARLSSLFPGCTHVRDVGLKQADDREIWQWAKDNSHTIAVRPAPTLRLVRPCILLEQLNFFWLNYFLSLARVCDHNLFNIHFLLERFVGDPVTLP